MSATLRRIVLPAVLVAMVTAGCSSGTDGGEEDRGLPADEVCGAFAKEPQPSSALKAIAGEGNFTSDLSEPEKVIGSLRDAARTDQGAKTRTQPIPFCWLLPAKGGEWDLQVTFREALSVPERDTRLQETVTYFTTGERASSSDSLASVFFACRMKDPAHEIFIQAQLEAPGVNEVPEKERRAHQVTVANAAARKVASDLGCQNDTKLVSGVPTPEPGQ
ncbi:hypothetical protein [Streptomyces sp. FIT100]|uniref:hypothetical protein n=1 Tax=Streptomyces sp. FIT100 TaxID=2837956 RepID=UPI0021CA345A|nr:hypothetical protein [Streptomyces sp. FIT100]UUN27152.1 hypothetical protein KK483_12630 [Streptomyces sp. FIT100]